MSLEKTIANIKKFSFEKIFNFNTYLFFRFNKKSNLKNQNQKLSLDESDDEGLALLIPDIQETAALVQSATYSELSLREEQDQASKSLIDLPIATIEQKYLEIMKKLQFGKWKKYSIFQFLTVPNLSICRYI